MPKKKSKQTKKENQAEHLEVPIGTCRVSIGTYFKHSPETFSSGLNLLDLIF